jgi:hypothetical protein
MIQGMIRPFVIPPFSYQRENSSRKRKKAGDCSPPAFRTVSILDLIRFPLTDSIKIDGFTQSVSNVSDLAFMAEGEGFEPPWACALTVFKTAPL